MSTDQDQAQEQSLGATMEIQVTQGGPFVVTGGVPLARRRPVVSDRDEPIAWETTQELDSSEEYSLCRCGHSADKPFCDGSHRDAGIADDEAAEHLGYDERAEDYPGPAVTLRDARSLCEHAGFCANRVTNVWRMVGRTDDHEVRDEMVAMVERCPSGALTYAVDGETDRAGGPAGHRGRRRRPAGGDRRSARPGQRGAGRRVAREPTPDDPVPLRCLGQQALLRRQPRRGRVPRLRRLPDRWGRRLGTPRTRPAHRLRAPCRG